MILLRALVRDLQLADPSPGKRRALPKARSRIFSGCLKGRARVPHFVGPLFFETNSSPE